MISKDHAVVDGRPELVEKASTNGSLIVQEADTLDGQGGVVVVDTATRDIRRVTCDHRVDEAAFPVVCVNATTVDASSIAGNDAAGGGSTEVDPAAG